jgi:hypothetical protein
VKNADTNLFIKKYLEFFTLMKISIIADPEISKLSVVIAHRYWPKKALIGGRVI